MTSPTCFVIDFDGVNWQSMASQIHLTNNHPLNSQSNKCDQEVPIDEEVATSNLVKNIIKGLQGTIEYVLFYFQFKTRHSQKILTEIRKQLCEEEKLSDKIISKSENLSTRQGEARSPVEQRLKIIFGMQHLFFELGRLFENSYNTVVYSNNCHFFQRNYIQSITEESKKTGRQLISQRKISCLLGDLKNLELELTLESDKDQTYSKVHKENIEDTKEKDMQSLSTKPEINQTMSREFSDNPVFIDNFSDASKSTKATTIDSATSKNIMMEMNRNFKRDHALRSSLIGLLEKLPKHFNKVSENESLKFINALENLVCQHLNKVEKNKKSKMTEAEKEQYFLFVRDYLVKHKVTNGVILDMWCKSIYGNSKEKMVQSHSVKFDFGQLELLIQSLKASKEKFTLKGYKLKGHINVYGCICYTIIKKMLQDDLNQQEKPITTTRKLCDNIHSTIKNYYNSKSISKDQKTLLKTDSKIRYIVAEIFKYRGIWKQEEEKFIINTSMIENQLIEFNKYESAKVVSYLIKDINKAIVE
ncbi:unnamed protein product [Moneuplotes crassus]|uniref:Uncharacterized protein n=1 Tax=Euplotes crassus TaxID=5936 RepID=A0AAD1Y1M4_EUPCR|nr:unnamed protein product [Moneuplotes crassus]